MQHFGYAADGMAQAGGVWRQGCPELASNTALLSLAIEILEKGW